MAKQGPEEERTYPQLKADSNWTRKHAGEFVLVTDGGNGKVVGFSNGIDSLIEEGKREGYIKPKVTKIYESEKRAGIGVRLNYRRRNRSSTSR